MIQVEYSLVFQMELQVVMDIYIISFAIRKKGGLTDGVLNSLVRYVMKYLIGKSHHFNPSTLKISLGIFPTIFHTILIKLVWRIWLWIKLWFQIDIFLYSHQWSTLYCKGKFCLGCSGS